jgi:hypothetical protein
VNLAEHMARGLFVGWQFLRFDPAALKFLEGGNQAALRSFAALFFTLPIYALSIYLISLDTNAPRFAATPMPALLAGHILVYPLFALATFYLARFLNRAVNFVRFLNAYNWSRVYALALLLPVEALIGFRLTPAWTDNALLVATAVFVLIYQGSVAGRALGVFWFHAGLIALLDWVLILLVERSLVNLLVPVQ